MPICSIREGWRCSGTIGILDRADCNPGMFVREQSRWIHGEQNRIERPDTEKTDRLPAAHAGLRQKP